ncbi:hypothetical protein EVAR_67465_1 [Eumeta japonica]|uniref:Uncharacterized protein n=1 Tax=Eumeta variegata TaxID=151549 RepID=A0A4C1ZTA2_EUMVA|nr:hypothetical protein EVAR_67465_1 [Eumeta japonica]
MDTSLPPRLPCRKVLLHPRQQSEKPISSSSQIMGERLPRPVLRLLEDLPSPAIIGSIYEAVPYPLPLQPAASSGLKCQLIEVSTVTVTTILLSFFSFHIVYRELVCKTDSRRPILLSVCHH